MVNKRYYKKKGPSFKEHLKCPLCGKNSPIGYFSQDHFWGVYRQWFIGRGKMRWERAKKSKEFLTVLVDGLVGRFLELLQEFAGCRYYSQYDVDELVDHYEKLLSQQHFIPPTKPSILVPVESSIIIPQKPIVKAIVKPYKVVIE